MFDPSGLKVRYAKLVGWQGGMWINYWTQTNPQPHNDEADTNENTISTEEEALYNNLGVLELGVDSPVRVFSAVPIIRETDLSLAVLRRSNRV
jgi:hypothetical protein